MTRIVTLREFRAELGCHERQIGLWEKAGLAYSTRKAKRGRPEHIFDREAALRWVAEKGTGKWPVEAARILRADGRKKKAGGKKSQGKRERKAEAGGGALTDETTNALVTSAERFRWWTERERLAGEEGNLAEAAICAKNRVEAGKAVAQLQEQVTTQAKETGLLVVASEMEGRFLKVLATVRNNILGVPDSLMPLLIPFLRNPEDAVRVRDMMEGKVEDALRHIAGAEGDD